MPHLPARFVALFAIPMQVGIWYGQYAAQGLLHMLFRALFRLQQVNHNAAAVQGSIAQAVAHDGSQQLFILRSSSSLYSVVAAIVRAWCKFVYQHLTICSDKHLYSHNANQSELFSYL